ncbi:MAG: pepT [Ignavibacteria bacterium]|nr:pepT [Ignavibacteria bacterium]
MQETALVKFLRYAKIDTQSKEDVNETPSTQKQFNLSRLLVDELKQFGITDAELDEHCYVTATIPKNTDKKVSIICFVAHVDTSPEVTDTDVKPQVIENYLGGDIVLPGDNSIIIKESENRNLRKCIGGTIVTTDGTTLLGADNKAGVAAIMTAAERLMNDSSIIHGDVKICFTPDEEVGKGTEYFPFERINAEYAYTVDGDMPGELNKETFSANSATITIHGRDIHPGMAKDIMVNSVRAAADIIAMLPKHMSPETTDKYQPYIHPLGIEGGVMKTTIRFILRDFETSGLETQREILQNVIAVAQTLHPRAKFELVIKESYRNMREKLEEKPEVLEWLWEAAVRTGTDPYWEPIRGGTDGSKLSWKGLPTPNIYTGGQNFHSRNEWLSVDGMNKAVETIINLVQIIAEK